MDEELRGPRVMAPLGEQEIADLWTPVLRQSHAEREAEEARALAAEEERKKKQKEEAAFQRKIKQFQEYVNTNGIMDAEGFLGATVGTSRDILLKAVPFLRFGPPPGPTPRQKRMIEFLQTYIENNDIRDSDRLIAQVDGRFLFGSDPKTTTREEILPLIPSLRFPSRSRQITGGAYSYAPMIISATSGMFVSPVTTFRMEPQGSSGLWNYPVDGDVRPDSLGQLWIYQKDQWFPTGGAVLNTDGTLADEEVERRVYGTSPESRNQGKIQEIQDALKAGLISRETALSFLNRLPGTKVVEVDDLNDEEEVQKAINGVYGDPKLERRKEVYLALQKFVMVKGLTVNEYWNIPPPPLCTPRITENEMGAMRPYLRFYERPGVYSSTQMYDPDLPVLTIGDLLEEQKQNTELTEKPTTERDRQQMILDDVVGRMGNIAPNMRELFKKEYSDSILNYAKRLQSYDMPIRRDTPMAIDLGWQGADMIGINGIFWLPSPGVNVMPDRFFQLLIQSKGGRANAVNDALEELNARATRGIKGGFKIR